MKSEHGKLHDIDADLMVAKAKRVISIQQSILRHWEEGLSAVASAQALNVSPATVEHLRRLLQLTRSRPTRPERGQKSNGRVREVRLVVEVTR